jgi:hypothetical protein
MTSRKKTKAPTTVRICVSMTPAQFRTITASAKRNKLARSTFIARAAAATKTVSVSA